MNRLTTDFAIAIALVAITLLPLGLRAASIVMISIPLSLAIGLSRTRISSAISLNQISIAGFVVALGLLVDDSIVVVENIARFLREGHSRTQAALLATRQIFFAIIGCTATLAFAFLPLMMLSGDAGQVHSRPADGGAGDDRRVAARRAHDHSVPREPHAQGAEKTERGNRLLQWITGGIHRFYQPLLHRALARPRLTVWGSLAACVVVIDRHRRG